MDVVDFVHSHTSHYSLEQNLYIVSLVRSLSRSLFSDSSGPVTQAHSWISHVSPNKSLSQPISKLDRDGTQLKSAECEVLLCYISHNSLRCQRLLNEGLLQVYGR